MAVKTFDAKVFNPEAFGKYMERIPRVRTNALLKSNVFKHDDNIHTAFSTQTGTNYAIIPMLGRITGTPVNYNGSTTITTNSSKTYSRGVVVIGRACAWTEKDFSYDITGGTDFMENVATQIGEFWEDIYNDTVLSILKGVFSMSSGKEKTFVDTHSLDISAETKDNTVDVTTLNNAIQKACGDNKAKFSAVFMHSQVATNLENIKAVKYLTYTDESGIERDLTIAMWNGRRVFIDDNLPTEQDTSKTYTKYTTYILGEGAFNFEEVGAKVPYEMIRQALTNGGEDTLKTY